MVKKQYNFAIIFLLLFTAILNYLDRQTLNIANIEIAHVFKMGPAEIGFLISVFMWPYALASLPAGYLIDRFGINKIMLASIITWSTACILGGLVIGFYSIFLTRILLGIAEAPFFLVATKIVREFFPTSQRARVSSIIAIGPRLASVLAPIILVELIILTGWRGMFIILGTISLMPALIWLYLRKKATFQEDEVLKKTKQMFFKEVLKNKIVIFICIGNLSSSYVYWLFLTWLPYYFVEVKHLNLSEMGVATSISFASGIISVILGGIISDLMLKNRFCIASSRLAPVIIGCLIASISIIALSCVDNIFLIICVISVTIFCLGLKVAPIWAFIADISPPHLLGTISGVQNFANFIGAGLAPLITGAILEATNKNFFIVFIISGIIGMFGSVSYIFVYMYSKKYSIS